MAVMMDPQIIVDLLAGFEALMKHREEHHTPYKSKEGLGKEAAQESLEKWAKEKLAADLGQDDASAVIVAIDARERWLRLKDLETKAPSRKGTENEDKNQYKCRDGHAIAEDNSQKCDQCPVKNKSGGTQAVQKCPFAQITSQHLPSSQNLPKDKVGSFPTPPETENHFADGRPDPLPRSRSLSMNDSIPKCPIRLLDKESPEEIAKYFESHKHEIPRSHEICVKRYQSNEQSIRSLDAKYGDLVNMIKGLGLKHQAMLPPKEEDQSSATPHSNLGVQNWASRVPANNPSYKDTQEGDKLREERVGHFDRALREIRVGESPSRPWGIHVPGQQPASYGNEGIPPSFSKDQKRVPGEDSSMKRKVSSQNDLKQPKPSQMVFTGPVFIGYPPDQVSSLLDQLPLGKGGEAS